MAAAQRDGPTLWIKRVLPAPRLLVFRACTEPDLLAKWWGPDGFTAPSVEVDLRIGGSYRIAMQPPEGDLVNPVSWSFLSAPLPPNRGLHSTKRVGQTRSTGYTT